MSNLLSKKKSGWEWRGIFIIFLIFISSLAYFFFNIFLSGSSVSISFDIPEHVVVGKTAEIGVILQNNSKKSLEEVSMALILPNGMQFVDSQSELRVARDRGVIDPKEVVKETFMVVAIDSVPSEKDIKAEVNYKSVSLPKKLLTSKLAKVVVKPSINLSINLGEVVASGDNFQFALNIKNELLKESTIFLKSEEIKELGLPSLSKKMSLPSQAEEKISLSGINLLSARDKREIIVRIYDREDETANLITEAKAMFVSEPSFIDIKALVNEEDNFSPKIGDVLNYTLVITNDTKEALEDVSVLTTLDGELFETENVLSSGNILDNGKKISWDRYNTKELETLDPKEKVFVSFTVRVKNKFPDLRNVNDKNYNLDIITKTDFLKSGSRKMAGVYNHRMPVSGSLNLVNKILFRDAEAGFINEGPFPPLQSQKTTYTVRWNLNSVGSDMSNVSLSTTLPSNVTLTDNKKVSLGELVLKDSLLEWKIPKVLSGSGFLFKSPEAIFQIEALPNSGDKGKEMKLLDEVTISGEDDHSRTIYKAKTAPKTTNLTDDPTIKEGDGVVR